MISTQDATSFQRHAELLRQHYRLGPELIPQQFLRGTSSESWKVLDVGTGKVLCLRVCDQSKRAASVEAELLWRESLRAHSRAPIASVVYTNTGEPVVQLLGQEGLTLNLEEFITSDTNFDFPPLLSATDRAAAAGLTLADLHRAGQAAVMGGASIPQGRGFSTQDLGRSLAASSHFDCDSRAELKEIWSTVFCEWQEVASGLPQVVIHGDFHPGNCAWRSGECVGVFDFEYARKDSRILDVAYAILFFCVDWTSAKVAVDEQSLSKLVRSYEEIAAGSEEGRFSVAESAALTLAIRFVTVGCWCWAIEARAQGRISSRFELACRDLSRISFSAC